MVTGEDSKLALANFKFIFGWTNTWDTTSFIHWQFIVWDIAVWHFQKVHLQLLFSSNIAESNGAEFYLLAKKEELFSVNYVSFNEKLSSSFITARFSQFSSFGNAISCN